MTDYSPTTEEVRARHAARVVGRARANTVPEESRRPMMHTFTDEEIAAHDAEIRASVLAEQSEATSTEESIEQRYPMPERDDYETSADWVTAVVMVQGKRQGWIDHASLLAEQSEPSRQIKQLLRDLTDPDDCWFDHRGGCQAHGYLSLKPGEKCPHAEAKELLVSWEPVEENGENNA